MNMLRRRRRFTEAETRYFLVQVIGACHFMHTNQVIHRDLKLGNLLLDAHMNIKVGDFGLAALIESPGERKKYVRVPMIVSSFSSSLGQFVAPRITSRLKFFLIQRMDIALKSTFGR